MNVIAIVDLLYPWPSMLHILLLRLNQYMGTVNKSGHSSFLGFCLPNSRGRQSRKLYEEWRHLMCLLIFCDFSLSSVAHLDIMRLINPKRHF